MYLVGLGFGFVVGIMATQDNFVKDCKEIGKHRAKGGVVECVYKETK